MTVEESIKNRLFAGYEKFQKSIVSLPEFKSQIEICAGLKDEFPYIETKSYAALIQIIGYYKYMSHKDGKKNELVLRGQTKCYGSMIPNAYRQLDKEEYRQKDERIDAFLEHFRNVAQYDLAPLNQGTTEPYLQHYGIATRWLDCCDTAPNALFFATHQRIYDKKTRLVKYVKSRNRYGVLYIIDCGGPKMPHRSATLGLSSFDALDLIDLRVAKPSKILRPHMQHGLLVRNHDHGHMDMQVIAALRFDCKMGRRWLGDAESLSYESYFPGPQQDSALNFLMSNEISTLISKYREDNIGAIEKHRHWQPSLLDRVRNFSSSLRQRFDSVSP